MLATGYSRFVISREEKLKLRNVFEVLLIQITNRQRITACDLLDRYFRQSLPALHFCRGDQTCSHEPGQVVARPRVLASQEAGEIGMPRIISHQRPDRLEERALTVCAGAV